MESAFAIISITSRSVGSVFVCLTRFSTNNFQCLFVSCETLILHFDGRGFDFSVVCLRVCMEPEGKHYFLSLPGVWEFQNLRFLALLWSSHNKEVLIQFRFLSKQMSVVCV